MSLISDPDYLIHSLRLTYLRHVEDLYGPRIISLNPRYLNNPHVLAAGLSNANKWPELNTSPSSYPSDEEDEKALNNRRRSGFPGATGLKYTQTIVGPTRIRAMGMGVSGKRSSTTKEQLASSTLYDSHAKRLRSDSAPTPVSTEPHPFQQTLESPGGQTGPSANVGKRRSRGGSSLSNISVPSPSNEGPSFDSEHTGPSNSPPLRRRVRHEPTQSRFSFDEGSRPTIQNLNPEDSSSGGDEEEGSLSEEDDPFGQVADADEGLDLDGDEFDPDFAPPRIGVISESFSDLASMPTSTISSSQPSQFPSSLQVAQSVRAQSKLSPVTETHADEHSVGTEERITSDLPGVSRLRNGQSMGSRFVMVTPLQMPQPGENANQRNRSVDASQKQAAEGMNQEAPEITFTRRPVPAASRGESALTAKMASSSSASSNPFTELYALISGRTQSAVMAVNVFFPQARKPAGQSLKLNVRKDASVEEVLGFALWSYWEESWQPKLDEGLGGEDDPKRKVKLSAVGWVLRIAEDDGEVDEDFPAPDRMSRISRFAGQDAWAVLEATSGQVTQNQQQESKIVRRPSRIIVAKKKQEVPPPALAPPATSGPGTSAIFGSTLGTSLGLSSSLGMSSSQGPPILLRIRTADTADTAVHYSTTISVSSGMYMQEALEVVCRRRKLQNSKEWALLVEDPRTLVPLDRTVASLQGKTDLVFIRRSSLAQYGFLADGDRRFGRTTDPNASIFKRISEVPEVAVSAQLDFTTAYKKYTVFRKLPMAVVRLERTLAIDGDYIHIMPSINKGRAVFESMKTASYHIKSVVACTQSAKSSSSFKLVVKRDSGEKRYDFEAEDNKLANEIVTCIRQLKNSVDRPGTASKSRRSRHVS